AQDRVRLADEAVLRQHFGDGDDLSPVVADESTRPLKSSFHSVVIVGQEPIANALHVPQIAENDDTHRLARVALLRSRAGCGADQGPESPAAQRGALSL